MPDVTAPFGFPYPEDTDLVRDGASDIEALAEGVNDQLALGYLYVGTRYYTSSGTFAKADPFGDSSFDGAKLRAIRVRVQGAGGGGGGGTTTGAGQCSVGFGAGGGAYAESFITDIAGLATTVTVTRGDGGAAGNGTAVTNGSAGGTSSFGALVSANGGHLGVTSGAFTPPRANVFTNENVTTATGELVIPGKSSGPQIVLTTTAQTTDRGGNSFLGAGAPPRTRSAVANGEVGTLFGGGGSGGFSPPSLGAHNGGAGAAGIVIVDVFA